jgi:hypothetical protein
VPAAAAPPPHDFTVLLPPGWVRIPLDGREGARAAALATAKAAGLAEPQRGEERERLLGLLKTALRRAREAGGVDIMISLAERNGVPLAASCLVSYVEHGDPVPMDMLAVELAREGGDVRCAEIAGCPAVRRRHMEPPVTRLDYHLPIPGRSGLLTLAFATPLEPLADPLVLLFDAIAESLRWRT